MPLRAGSSEGSAWPCELISQQPLDGVAQGGCLGGVLMHDHRPECGGAGGIGLLVLISRLGEGHRIVGVPQTASSLRLRAPAG